MVPRDSSRRDVLYGIGAASMLVAVAPRLVRAQPSSTLTPEMFGARGDGRTDDYDALKRMAQAVSRQGGGTVRFARGRHYLIDRIQIRGGPNRNDLTNIAFNRCHGLHIDLNGSTIHTKGDFHRSGDTDQGQFSWLNAIVPVVINQCSDVVVENGILNGHVDRMTKDPSVDERSGHGIRINSSSRVVLQGLHIHHFSGDGVYLDIVDQRLNTPCRDVRLDQVRLTNNARQGLSNVGAVGVVATDCEFSETGRTDGPYFHAPGAGVDIEPNRFPSERSDFRAVRCRFDNNRGYPVTSSSPDRVTFVELIDCSGRAPRLSRMSMRAERTLIRGGSWHNIQLACSYAARRYQRRIAIEVSGGQWAGEDPGWFPVYDLSARQPDVRIHDNRFELRSPRPFRSGPMFQCSNPNHRFEDNQIFVARTGHDGSGEDLVANFRGAKLVRGNVWRTDAAAPLRFVNDYRGAETVEGETFVGSFSALS